MSNIVQIDNPNENRCVRRSYWTRSNFLNKKVSSDDSITHGYISRKMVPREKTCWTNIKAQSELNYTVFYNHMRQ